MQSMNAHLFAPNKCTQQDMLRERERETEKKIWRKKPTENVKLREKKKPESAWKQKLQDILHCNAIFVVFTEVKNKMSIHLTY